MDTHQQGFAKLTAMIDAIEVGMLTTADESGHLRARPMATQRAEDGCLWFFTGRDSPKVDEIRKDCQVNVSYSDPANQIFVSVSGVARTSRDEARIRELWTGQAQRWFPEGPEDARIALLCVEITAAEFWDVDACKMRDLIKSNASPDQLAAATDHKAMS
ncbi:pyridoxamine 5'-phosphate oxidase family protein [Rhodomicrobium sp. Az07]|uniref:pyridoxamine 5'-phosphate oxidase family protein n=1 Tax=Rhodomicrobium sp. Az07 TaxID=2839034 RepID=UPI001BEC8D66|nr:pyridoxamine 5'-phosphate oxidase family protein [Rhodomicrobium sp. Az07]MBT3071199.1 pyridoxamine 5'-phosphate oxidase family protein [Rhodomicrobium sp. Az07]